MTELIMSHTSIIVLTYLSSIMTLFSLSSKKGEGEGAVYLLHAPMGCIYSMEM